MKQTSWIGPDGRTWRSQETEISDSQYELVEINETLPNGMRVRGQAHMPKAPKPAVTKAMITEMVKAKVKEGLTDAS